MKEKTEQNTGADNLIIQIEAKIVNYDETEKKLDVLTEKATVLMEKILELRNCVPNLSRRLWRRVVKDIILSLDMREN